MNEQSVLHLKDNKSSSDRDRDGTVHGFTCGKVQVLEYEGRKVVAQDNVAWRVGTEDRWSFEVYGYLASEAPENFEDATSVLVESIPKEEQDELTAFLMEGVMKEIRPDESEKSKMPVYLRPLDISHHLKDYQVEGNERFGFGYFGKVHLIDFEGQKVVAQLQTQIPLTPTILVYGVARDENLSGPFEEFTKIPINPVFTKNQGQLDDLLRKVVGSTNPRIVYYHEDPRLTSSLLPD